MTTWDKDVDVKELELFHLSAQAPLREQLEEMMAVLEDDYDWPAAPGVRAADGLRDGGEDGEGQEDEDDEADHESTSGGARRPKLTNRQLAGLRIVERTMDTVFKVTGLKLNVSEEAMGGRMAARWAPGPIREGPNPWNIFCSFLTNTLESACIPAPASRFCFINSHHHSMQAEAILGCPPGQFGQVHLA